ncbi:unnamed protein product [Trichogramma brassicae]|uniref:Uncharacterized protein n=1 Tax=Trichogramma brassicae TaxID=86971 RepID=A0A6H5I7M7_9HYME|nr:unnamed protein product [Trichogramma brassicae]
MIFGKYNIQKVCCFDVLPFCDVQGRRRSKIGKEGHRKRARITSIRECATFLQVLRARVYAMDGFGLIVQRLELSKALSLTISLAHEVAVSLGNLVRITHTAPARQLLDESFVNYGSTRPNPGSSCECYRYLDGRILALDCMLKFPPSTARWILPSFNKSATKSSHGSCAVSVSKFAMGIWYHQARSFFVCDVLLLLLQPAWWNVCYWVGGKLERNLAQSARAPRLLPARVQIKCSRTKEHRLSVLNCEKNYDEIHQNESKKPINLRLYWHAETKEEILSSSVTPEGVEVPATRRLRHYRSGLRALRRGRRPRQRGSVAQPEQHDLSASRAASRRGAGEIHIGQGFKSKYYRLGDSRCDRYFTIVSYVKAEPLSRAEVVRDVRRYSRTICPVKKCRLHANSLKEEIVLTRFRAREYQTAVRDLLGTFCNVNRLVDYVNYPLEPAEYWWQLVRK